MSVCECERERHGEAVRSPSPCLLLHAAEYNHCVMRSGGTAGARNKATLSYPGQFQFQKLFLSPTPGVSQLASTTALPFPTETPEKRQRVR